jgi:hypothetical protein
VSLLRTRESPGFYPRGRRVQVEYLLTWRLHVLYEFSCSLVRFIKKYGATQNVRLLLFSIFGIYVWVISATVPMATDVHILPLATDVDLG